MKKYATNPKWADHTATAKRIASMNIVIDKLHYKGHTDAWCKKHYDPYKFDDLNKVCDSILYTKDYVMHTYITWAGMIWLICIHKPKGKSILYSRFTDASG